VNVLFVLPEFPPDHGGGIATYYSELLSAMREQVDCSVIVGSAYLNGKQEYEWNGIKVVSLSTALFNSWMERFHFFSILPQLHRHLAAAFAIHEQMRGGEDYDVVETVDWGLLFVPWVTRRDKPTLVQLHGSCGQIAAKDPTAGSELEEIFIQIIEQTVLSKANLSTHSNLNAQWWSGFLERSVSVQPPPYALKNNSDVWTGTGEEFLSVGRVQKWKGVDVACRAWELLGDKAPRLLWLGRDVQFGAQRKSYSRFLEENFSRIWGTRVIPIGPGSPEKVRNLMANAACVLVPSIWDVYNLVAVEAMSLATPVIVSKGAGASELIDDGINGFVFEQDSPESMSESVERFLTASKSQRRSIGLAGWETIRKKLDPTNVANEKLVNYNSLTCYQTQNADPLFDLFNRDVEAGFYSILDNVPIKTIANNLMSRIFARATGK
jgi:glycosyltransferase involved in cell wall biosynthesis